MVTFADLAPGAESLLIYADHLEESGEPVRATHLRRRYGRSRSGLCLTGFAKTNRNGSGNGYGSGSGSGNGYGSDYGYGDGYSRGYGDVYGSGSGSGNGYGSDYGSGSGFRPITKESKNN